MINSEKIKSFIPEILALLLYMGFMIIIMYYHEPWYDEAQAWLIARDAPIKEILFLLPHYEGHPPIWHLMLLPFAKSGAPYEFSLKLVSFIFSGISMALFIFKAPFKRIFKLTIPFTYFFFYQYGVISRPYCIIMLGFILSAVVYKTKDTNPFRFIIALGIVCSASAYGIILSAGIAIVWIIEIFYKNFSINFIRSFRRDSRFFALILLLLYNLLLVISIIPLPDTYGIDNVVRDYRYISKFIYMFIVLPGDATYLDICNYLIPQLSFNIYSIVGVIGSSIIILILILFTKSNNKLLLLLIPYSLMALFSTVVYFSTHHIGIITIFFLFVIWCCIEDKKEVNFRFPFLSNLGSKVSDVNILNHIHEVLLGIIILVSILWSIIASINEIYNPYGEGRNLAEFIKDNNLDKYKIMAEWKFSTDYKNNRVNINTNLVNIIATLPYFNRNICYNLNASMPSKCYIIHKVGNDEDNIELWKKNGPPDVVVGYARLTSIFGNSLSYDDYACVFDAKGSYIWKSEVIDYDSLVYIRKDLMDQFPNLKEISQ